MAVIDVTRFEEFLNEHKNIVYTLCLSFVRNPYDAEDLAQEAFLSALNHFAAFDGANPKSWICTIAANKCRDFLKSPAKRISAVDPADLVAIPDEADSVEAAAERTDSDDRIAALIRRLREPYQSVAAAYYGRDETLTEISRRTGEPLKTVATRLYRARTLLKALWKEEHPHDTEPAAPDRYRAEEPADRTAART